MCSKLRYIWVLGVLGVPLTGYQEVERDTPLGRGMTQKVGIQLFVKSIRYSSESRPLE
jgi:hypothetical protein